MVLVVLNFPAGMSLEPPMMKRRRQSQLMMEPYTRRRIIFGPASMTDGFWPGWLTTSSQWGWYTVFTVAGRPGSINHGVSQRNFFRSGEGTLSWSRSVVHQHAEGLNTMMCLLWSMTTINDIQVGSIHRILGPFRSGSRRQFSKAKGYRLVLNYIQPGALAAGRNRDLAVAVQRHIDGKNSLADISRKAERRLVGRRAGCRA